MIVTVNNDNRLVIVHRDRMKEWGLGLVIACIGFAPFFQSTDEWFLFIGKFVFLGMFMVIGLLNVRDEYEIEFNANTTTITIAYRNVIDVIRRAKGGQLTVELQRCRQCETVEEIHQKKKLYKIKIVCRDGLTVPLTDTLYFDRIQSDQLAKTINEWVNNYHTRVGTFVNKKQPQVHVTDNNTNVITQRVRVQS